MEEMRAAAEKLARKRAMKEANQIQTTAEAHAQIAQ